MMCLLCELFYDVVINKFICTVLVDLVCFFFPKNMCFKCQIYVVFLVFKHILGFQVHFECCCFF